MVTGPSAHLQLVFQQTLLSPGYESLENASPHQVTMNVVAAEDKRLSETGGFLDLSSHHFRFPLQFQV